MRILSHMLDRSAHIRKGFWNVLHFGSLFSLADISALLVFGGGRRMHPVSFGSGSQQDERHHRSLAALVSRSCPWDFWEHRQR